MDELVQSRQAIERELGVVPVALAYPSDKFDVRVAAATQRAGCLMAVTTRFGYLLDPATRYRWPRIGVGPGLTPSGFARIVTRPTVRKSLETTG